MIKELIFATLVQGADVSSSYYVKAHNPNVYEINPNLPLTSIVAVSGIAYGMDKIRSRKYKIIVGGLITVGKGIIVYSNLKHVK